jgi:hypothetical protein
MMPPALERFAEHVVALYHSDDFVEGRVASFIAEGLTLGERVVVLCTKSHWSAVASRLESGAVDLARAASDRRLVFIDAEEVLDRIADRGTVPADTLNDILRPLMTPTTKTRVYGELVSLLAARGEIDAALAVERLGQQLAHTGGVQVMCGYHVNGARPLTASEIARIRAVHDRSFSEGDSESLSPAATPEQGQFHAVRFYQDRESLARIVGRFLGEGFVAGSPAVVIATPEHRDAIGRALAAQSFDVDRLEATGELIVVDADRVLAAFMVDGMPERGLFESAVVPLLEKACRGRTDCVVRAYGEMVDVLWKGGHTVAAVRLETLWNQLAQSHAFALLCGYSMGHFYKDAAQQQICRQHTHIVSDSGEAATLR